MDETHLFQQSLHDLVVAMSIYPQVPALLIGPVDTKLIDSDLFKYVDGYYVINDAQFLETDEEGRYSLSDYAWAHLEECTLQFTWQSLNQAEILRHFLFEYYIEFLNCFIHLFSGWSFPLIFLQLPFAVRRSPHQERTLHQPMLRYAALRICQISAPILRHLHVQR